MIEQYKCPSYADDENKIQNCKCGKCDMPHTNNKEAKIEETAQELTEIHVNIEQSDESHKRYYEILKTALSEAIDWGASDWKGKTRTIDNIIELVEDKDFPARRSILDYVEELFGYPKDLSEYIKSKLPTPQDNKE